MSKKEKQENKLSETMRRFLKTDPKEVERLDKEEKEKKKGKGK